MEHNVYIVDTSPENPLRRLYCGDRTKLSRLVLRKLFFAPKKLNMKTKILLLTTLLIATACGKSSHSIYQGLAEDEDGVINSVVDDENQTEDQLADRDDAKTVVLPDELTSAEANLIKQYLSNQTAKVSFAVVDAEDDSIVRAYRSLQLRKLASVTKVSTSIAALENVNGIEVNKVKAMLKSSDNGEASRYVRLAAKAIEGWVSPGSNYSTPHSCPGSSTLQKENEAAKIVLSWIKKQVSDIDWSGAALKDGAGCDYGNVMTPLQMLNVLRLADSKGKAFAGLSYEQLLSISGVDGTWASRNTDAKGRVLAKTGTLSVAGNLAGYFYAKRNGVLKKYYFAVLVEKSSSQTNANVRTMIEGLVRNWINYYSQQKGESLALL